VASAERLMEMIGRGETPTGLTQIAFVISLLAFVNGGMALAFVGVAALLHRRRLTSYFTAAPRFRWRLLLLGLGLFAVTIGPLLLASAALDPKAPGAPILAISPDLAGRLTYAAMVVSLFLIAAAAEELVFRGWLVKVVGAWFPIRAWCWCSAACCSRPSISTPISTPSWCGWPWAWAWPG
jgi:membrane protease YdiL (CAAX protease family)